MINSGQLNDAQVNGFYAADEEAYQLWLRDPSAAVGHIVTLGYNGTSAVYPNWVNYVLSLSDFPLPGYHEVISSIPSFKREIGEDFTGYVSASLGNLVLDNTDGALDQWVNLAFDGQRCLVTQGDPAWADPMKGNDPTRFRTVFDCVAEVVANADRNQITIQLRGADYIANTPIQTRMIPPAVGANAPSNTPVPLAFGNVFNISPVCIDEPNQVYQANDGAFTSFDNGRDSGVPFRTSQIAISAVNAGTNVLSTATAHGFVKNTRVRCDLGTLPVSADWYCCAWNGTVFCAIAYASAIAATSPDGITWTKQTMPVSDNWHSIAWNGTVFCAIAFGGTVAATSPDGINWTQRALPAVANWYSIAWNGTVFCAIANGSTIAATSADGIAWTQRALPASTTQWNSIASNGSIFCAIANDGAAGIAATSPDGAAWTPQSLPAIAGYKCVAWNGSVFCTIGQTTTAAATSPDGAAWTARTMPSSAAWIAVAWNGSVFCAIAFSSTAAATSPDGITWTARTLPATANWEKITWNGYVFCIIGDSSSKVSVSSDGITWSATANTLPAPLAINTDYWVPADGLTSTDFKLSLTRGGTEINITGTDTGAPLVGFHWTSDLATSKIYLDSKPAGQFTIDGVAGSAVAANIVASVLGVANIDAASKAAFAATCGQTIGVYISERQNRRDIASGVMSGLGAWFGASRYGMVLMGRIEASYGSYDIAIAQDLMIDASFVLDHMIPPQKRHRAGYRKNWTDQTGKLAAGVSAEMRGLFSSPYSMTAPSLGADEGPAGQEFHQLAQLPDVFETMMALPSDALAESRRRDTMFYGWGAVYRFEVGKIGAEIDIGAVLLVTHTRYGFQNGVNVPVISIDDNPTDRKSMIKVLAALAPYTPGQI